MKPPKARSRLLIGKALKHREPPFTWSVSRLHAARREGIHLRGDRAKSASAKSAQTVAEGDGPVNALDDV
jgi:hypothetical protein